jgi:CBS domain-containing protein
MKAADVMNTAVLSVSPDTPTGRIAKLLRERAVSAVPVVDASGAPIGMVSEGDLIVRAAADREARRDWWLTLLAEGEELSPDFVATLRGPAVTAQDVMSTPVITVAEDTEIGAVAKLLTDYRIKRVPVVREGKVVGIVSRADLVRVIAEQAAAETQHRHGARFAETLAGLDERFLHLQHRHKEQATSGLVPSETASPDVSEFRHLVAEHEQQEIEEKLARDRAAAELRQHQVAELTDRHVSDTQWRTMLQRARQAAEHGAKEFALLRFPSSLCSDAGRTINSNGQEWANTLRGEAAELYLRWQHDLKSHGFRLSARVLDFPGGMPGDIGLFLSWGE